MATFEDNNPFASPSSPASSQAHPYVPFEGTYSFSPTGQTHTVDPSFESNRPVTPSSDDVPANNYRATNSDFSAEQQLESMPETSGEGVTGITGKDDESCCRIDEILRQNPEMRIVITDAGKASDGGAHFIAYTIDVGVLSSVSMVANDRA